MFVYSRLLALLLTVFVAFHTSAQPVGITIAAPEDLHPVLVALYNRMGIDAPLQFADGNADILATSEIPADALDVGHFLPDVALVLLTESTGARDFIGFAISPEGQQVLIDHSLLPREVTLFDQAGLQVTVPQPVNRSISPYSLATYMIYTANAANTLVAAGYLGARDPLGFEAMTRIDPRFPQLSENNMSQETVNIEQVAALEPEVILASSRSDWLEPVEQLNIPIVRFEGESLQALKDGMRIVGQLFGPHAAYQTQRWIDYYDDVIASINTVLEDNQSIPTVLFTGTEPTRAASGDMYQTSIIRAAGGVSVTAELGGFWNNINLEQVVTWNPDVILVPPYGRASVEAITENADWQMLDAVQNGRVYRVPKLVAPWDTPVPDSVLGIIWLAERLHPGEIPLNCADEARFFYNEFYNYDIPDEEIIRLCGS